MSWLNKLSPKRLPQWVRDVIAVIAAALWVFGYWTSENPKFTPWNFIAVALAFAWVIWCLHFEIQEPQGEPHE